MADIRHSCDDPDDRHIVVDCPECHRTIWAGSRCLHGKIPLPEPVPVVPKPDTGVTFKSKRDDNKGRNLKGGTNR